MQGVNSSANNIKGIETKEAPDVTGGLPKPWTVLQLAEFLDVSPLTIYRLVRQGRLPGVVRLGRKVLIPRCVVESLTGVAGRDEN